MSHLELNQLHQSQLPTARAIESILQTLDSGSIRLDRPTKAKRAYDESMMRTDRNGQDIRQPLRAFLREEEVPDLIGDGLGSLDE